MPPLSARGDDHIKSKFMLIGNSENRDTVNDDNSLKSTNNQPLHLDLGRKIQSSKFKICKILNEGVNEAHSQSMREKSK